MNHLYQRSKRLVRMTTALIAGVSLGSISAPQAEQVTAAVAANFSGAIKQLAPVFERETGHRLVLSFASTGTLYVQIHNGAPFDVFLSADDQRPKQLVADGLAINNSHFIYAIGQLALWSTQADLIDVEGKILNAANWPAKGIYRLALANPKTAPYGAAAMQTLTALGQVDVATPFIVTGQNIAQTFQFTASENAQLGFVAYSQVLALAVSQRGSYWLVPHNLYTPIKQSAVLLNKGRDNIAAHAFLDFLQSPQATHIISGLGYHSGYILKE